MRFKQFLLEMPQYKKETIPDKKEMENVLKDRYDFFKNDKVIDSFKYDGFLFELIQGNSSLWFIIKDGIPVGFSGFRGLDEDIYNFVQVGSLYISKEYRNKGLSTKLYEYMIEKYGGIISDYELSKNDKFGSYYIYEKLLKKYFGYEKYYENIKRIKTLSVDTNRHSKIIISKKEIKENIEESYFQSLLESPIGYENISLEQDDLEAYGVIYSKKETNEEFSKEGFDFKIYKTSGYSTSEIWLVYKDNNLVGMTKISIGQKFNEIINTIIHNRVRGKGIGSILYKTIIDYYGYIVSDVHLSNNENGSWYLYKKLIPKYHSYEMTYEPQTRKWELEKIEEMPKEKKSRIVLSKKELKNVEDLK